MVFGVDSASISSHWELGFIVSAALSANRLLRQMAGFRFEDTHQIGCAGYSLSDSVMHTENFVLHDTSHFSEDV